MKTAVIINSSAGSNSEDDSARIEKAFKNFNADVKIFETAGEKIGDTVRSAAQSGFDVIIAAGGDGTINSVINNIAETDLSFGIIPLGTLNHSAKDAGIPLEIEDAVRVITEKNINRVDLAEVNGHYFINNSSVGIYPKIVIQRDHEMEKLGYGKWFAMFRAVINVFWNHQGLNLNVVSNGKNTEVKTPFIFVGNNVYAFDLFNLGKREAINEGVLSLYYPKTTGRFTMLRFALLALINRIDQEKDFVNITSGEIKIYSKRKKLAASADGEVLYFNTPLEYKIHPGKLKLIVPGKK